MLVGVLMRASVVVLPVPIVRPALLPAAVALFAPTVRPAVLPAAIVGAEFMRPLAAVSGIAVCAALLFTAPAFMLPPRAVMAEFAFAFVLAIVAWLALFRFAGRMPD